MWQIKHFIITMISSFTGNCVVNLFGRTYLVAGNFVSRIR